MSSADSFAPGGPGVNGRPLPPEEHDARRLNCLGPVGELRLLVAFLLDRGHPRDEIVRRVAARAPSLGQPPGDAPALVDDVLRPRRPAPREVVPDEELDRRRQGQRLADRLTRHGDFVGPAVAELIREEVAGQVRSVLAAELPDAVAYILSRRRRRGGAA
jgi:hypothetical protein